MNPRLLLAALTSMPASPDLIHAPPTNKQFLPVRVKGNDAERLRAAEEKRNRKNAKRRSK